MGGPIDCDSSNVPAVTADNSGSAEGVWGHSNNGIGVHGINNQGSAPDGPGGPGVVTLAAGVFGESSSNEGVFGASGSQHGVHGVNGKGSTLSPIYGCGVWGDSAEGYGVFATSGTHNGLFGSSKGDDGIHGETTSQAHFGVSGLNNSSWPCTAIQGTSENGHGIHGINGPGGAAQPNAGCGVWGESQQGIGVYGVSQSGSAGYFKGDVLVTGDVKLVGGDCAERFDLKTLEMAEPGTVMVIDDSGALRRSNKAYDRAVAGVVSGAGAFKPGIVLDQREDNAGRTTIALVGKVYCKVDADRGPISVGDLLTSSDTPGHAMKVVDSLKGFGAVIGKALGPMTSGQGLLPILVSLQ
jgi:hypothetical protein